jgi:hypothetical protein
MSFTSYPDNADVTVVLFNDDQQQWDELNKLCRRLGRDRIIVTRPVLGFDLVAARHPNLCCFTFKGYDGCVQRFVNNARMRGRPEHVELSECGAPGLFAEFFHMVSMLYTLVTPEVFSKLTPRINRTPYGGNIMFHGDNITASLFLTTENLKTYRSTQTAYGVSGQLARMESNDDATYMETWGASMLYTINALACGDSGVIERNRKMATDIVLKLKAVRGAANLLIGRR